MLRALVFLFVFIVNASSNTVIKKVENIVGTNEFQTHKALINHLFQEEVLYLSNNEIKYYNMFDTLQKNGLLNLNFHRPSEVQLSFEVTGDNKKGYKILNDILHTLGFRYYITKVLQSNPEKLNWIISLKVEYMLDPVMFLRELNYSGSKIIEITKKSKNHWFYKIDFENAKLLKAENIQKNEKVKFQKPLKPLFLDIKDAKSLQVISRNLNRWYPDIVFFDENLEVLKEIKKGHIHKGIKIDVPLGSRYVKITDKFNLINIKRGLTLIVR